LAARRKGRGAGRKHAIGMALAGGGPAGAVYEIGALRALDEAVEGLHVNALDVYVGVSAGAFVAANLANQLSSAQMCRAIVKHEPGEHPFVPETFFTPAFAEWARRGLSVPRLALEAAWHFARNPRDLSLAESLTRLGHALPVGIFDNEPIRHYLRNIYTMKGRTDDFRELGRRLYIVAAELESGRSVVFGKPGRDHVAVSRAVQASSALPGLYPPVDIDGHFYVDGVLNRTVHASVALDAGAKLLFCINPIVPVDVSTNKAAGLYAEGELLRRGLPSVLSQTFRTLIHSRLDVGMKRYDSLYEDADVILLEPDRDDYEMFFSNIFSFSERSAVCAHAYDSTRRDLLNRYSQLAPIIARHGLKLRRDILEDRSRELWRGVGLDSSSAAALTRSGGSRESSHATLERLDSVLARLQATLER
jgi:NTE family protein